MELIPVTAWKFRQKAEALIPISSAMSSTRNGCL